MRQLFLFLAIRWSALVFGLLLPAVTAFAGQLRVTPSEGIAFDNNVKFSMLTVINEGGLPVTIDIYPAEWNQDKDGNDSFVETGDLVVSPKVMALEKGEQRVIRAGYRGASLGRERIFRLFFAERSGPARNETVRKQAAGLVSVPVFIKPAEEKAAGSLQTIGMSDGLLTITAKNDGNVHVIVISVSIRGSASDGRELFTRELAGSYVLSGNSKPFRMAIPGLICGKLSRVEVRMKMNTGLLNGALNIESGMCGQ